MSETTVTSRARRILIVGGGYVGMYTALRLQKKFRPSEAVITVVDPQPHMTYQPFLPEAAAGSIEPRHVVVPLRKVLTRCRVLTGRIDKVEHATKRAWVSNSDGSTETIDYDLIIMSPGSIARTLPVPGLPEQGIAFKTVGEAIYLRNHVLSRMDAASVTRDPERRQRLLTFMVVGGGYAGIEALAELEDMSRYACRYYDGISPADLRWVLVEATNRVMPEVSPKMGVYTINRLTDRGIQCFLETRVETMVDGNVKLSDGTAFATETIIWTAGVKANPMLANTDLPLDARGRLRCETTLAVSDTPDAFSAGDCAAVPDLSKIETQPDATCSPSAQHAVRQAKVLADNVVATVRGETLADYKHRYAGSVASLGLYRGVADVYGIKLKGMPAWAMHRAYHLSRMPTTNRKVRIGVDWLMALLFRREVVALAQINDPKADFDRAAVS